MKKIKLSFVCKFIITIKETNYYSVLKVIDRVIWLSFVDSWVILLPQLALLHMLHHQLTAMFPEMLNIQEYVLNCGGQPCEKLVE